VYGEAFSQVLNSHEKALRVETRNTKGSAENVPLLEAGKLDLALVAGEIAGEALLKPGSTLRVITAMYGSPGMFAVRGDSPVRSIADLAGKPVALGAQGSGLTVLGRSVLRFLDVSCQEILLEKAGDGPAMVLDGRAAALWGAGVGWPGFEALAKAGGRFIAPNANEIPRILARQPLLKPMTLPAGTYPGQDAPIETVGAWSFVLAHRDFPGDTAFLLAKTIHAAEAALGGKLAQARQTTMANTVAAVPRPEVLHEGVRRYLAEAGLIPRNATRAAP